MTEETTPFKKHNWQEYKEMLEGFGYDESQIAEIEKIRNNFEEITKDQFDFLVQAGVITRTRKLKKIRTLFTDEKKVYYLDHYEKKYCWCGIFNEE